MQFLADTGPRRPSFLNKNECWALVLLHSDSECRPHCKCLFLGAPLVRQINQFCQFLPPCSQEYLQSITMPLCSYMQYCFIGIYWHGSPQVLKPSQQTKQASHNVQPEQRQQVTNTNPGNSATEMTGEVAHEGCRGGWKLEKELFQKCPTSCVAFLCSSNDGRSRNLNSGNYSILQFVTFIAVSLWANWRLGGMCHMSKRQSSAADLWPELNPWSWWDGWDAWNWSEWPAWEPLEKAKAPKRHAEVPKKANLKAQDAP